MGSDTSQWHLSLCQINMDEPLIISYIEMRATITEGLWLHTSTAKIGMNFYTSSNNVFGALGSQFCVLIHAIDHHDAMSLNIQRNCITPYITYIHLFWKACGGLGTQFVDFSLVQILRLRFGQGPFDDLTPLWFDSQIAAT